MRGREIYEIYAPKNAKWTEWVRPVPFVAIETYKRKASKVFIKRKIPFLDNYQEDTVIFVDLANVESIEYGLSLAEIGYRPIPLFNGVDEQIGSSATTDTYLVEEGLISGAERLKNIDLKNNANPVFLLDNMRLNRYRKDETIFDNSWDLYGQDIPSVDYFIKNNITKIIIVSKKVERDLRKIFFKFQSKGIDFYITDGYHELKKIHLKKTIKELFEKEEL